MQDLTIPTALTMTSLEISELTGKKHLHVMRDIRKMLVDLYGEDNQSKFGSVYKDAKNEERPMFALDRDHTMTLVTGYSAKLRMAVIQRWQELEAESAAKAPAMPDFSNPALAARAWADQYEARLLAEKTKAEIGSRREATAMATASVAVKKVDRLEKELDQSKQYCSVKRMQMIHHGQKFNWRELKSTSIEMELPPIDVFDQNYGTVKAYHVDVWREVYAVGIDD